MDYQDTATGPSFNPNIKPKSSKLGEFRNNVSHSAKHGLRIYKGHTPPVRAVYEDHLSYKCTSIGIRVESIGLHTFRNITVASNVLHGLAIRKSANEGYSVDGAIMVGSSQLLGGSTGYGMIGP